LKLLYLNHNVVGTGTYLRALHLGRAMVERGHQVTLVTTSPVRRFSFHERADGGVHVVEAPDLWWGRARTGWDPWNAARRWLRLRSVAPDLVHAFDGRPVVSIPGWLLTGGPRQAAALRVEPTAEQTNAAPPLVMDWADWWGRGGQIQQRSGWAVRTFFGPVETWFEEAFRGGAAAHTVISGALRDRALGLGLDPQRLLVLPNGCEPRGLQPADRVAARSGLGVPPGTSLAVHLGVLTPADMCLLTEALRLAAERLPQLRLVLVGRTGATVPQDLLDSGRVQVTGFVDAAEKDRWLGAADLCVAPLTDTIGSRGRWPSKVNDYLCAGRPTLITAVGDAAGLVRQRGLGWVTAAEPTAFAAGMLDALTNPGVAAEAGERARAVAERELAWGILGAGVEALYASAVQAAGRWRRTDAAETP
jgi:glycosyltransferase involved in cell wall biosynthesis